MEDLLKKFLFLFLFLFPSILNAQTITYSGANVGIGSANPGQVLDVQGTVRALGYINSLSLIATSNPSGASSVTFSGLNTGVKYVIYFNFLIIGNNLDLAYQFNGDAGNNYKGSQTTINNATHSGSQTTTTCYFDDTGTSAANTNYIGDIVFTSAETNHTRAYSYASTTDPTSTTVELSGCNYSGSSGLSSITISDPGGTLTGTANLYAIQ
jgi:hypothetical protein